MRGIVVVTREWKGGSSFLVSELIIGRSRKFPRETRNVDNCGSTTAGQSRRYGLLGFAQSREC